MDTAHLTYALMAEAAPLTSGGSSIAMMAQMPLPAETAAGEAPEWIHLLPAPSDGLVQTSDKRGPFTMAPFAEIIANTFARCDAFEIDVNHASFLSAPRGDAAPAAGWCREMQTRADGLWGRIDWTDEGRKLVAGRAYRRISPVVMHDGSKKITWLANASLVNRPNLRGLAALNAEEISMSFMERLAKMLGLAEGATEDQVMAAMEAKMAHKGDDGDKAAEKPDSAMQAAMAKIGEALGVTGSDPVAILAAAKTAMTAQPTEVAALQAEVATLTTSLNGLSANLSRDAATTFVDGEIRKGRAGIKPLRDRYISMHMADPTGTAELIAGLPILTGSGMTQLAPSTDGSTLSLNAEETSIAAMLGLSTEEFTASRKAELEARS